MAFLFPSCVMSIIGRNYASLKDETFKQKYGSVTEGLKIHMVASEEVYQAHFYSAFLMQRLLFAGSLVVFYAWPYVQLISIAAASLLVSLRVSMSR